MLSKAFVSSLLENVNDPEIPVLSIFDLGIVTDIIIHDSESVEVFITPTYTGCPAMNTFEVNIKAALQQFGIKNVRVTTVLSPAWTTDRITEEGRLKLKAYGIAPPVDESPDKAVLFADAPVVACPLCGSDATTMISQFGSTACKALYRCDSCKEPFDYFKCHR